LLQVPMLMENNGKAVSVAKEQLAVKAAVAACDALDGVADGVLRDPRACNYSATDLVCKPGKHLGCLTNGEAKAIDSMWDGSRDVNGSLLWYGIPRGASLGALAGEKIMSIPDGQAKYWVEYDSKWDYQSLTYETW
jgi:hypothetical protein